MNQIAIDFEHLVRRSDPETSRRAAQKTERFVSSHEAKIYGAIHDAGAYGATFKEIAAVTGLDAVAVARRLSGMSVIERRLKSNPSNDKDYIERNGCAVWWKKQ